MSVPWPPLGYVSVETFNMERRVADTLREENARLRAGNKRLRAGLRMLSRQEYDSGYTPEGFAEAVLNGDEPLDGEKG